MKAIKILAAAGMASALMVQNESAAAADANKFKGNQNPKSTEPMSELNKIAEDDKKQGQGSTGSLNHGDKGPKRIASAVGARTTPKVNVNGPVKVTKPYQGSKSGASLVYVTVEDSDSAQRLIKKMFSKGLVAQAEFNDNDHQRQFLQFGDLHQEV